MQTHCVQAAAAATERQRRHRAVLVSDRRTVRDVSWDSVECCSWHVADNSTDTWTHWVDSQHQTHLYTHRHSHTGQLCINAQEIKNTSGTVFDRWPGRLRNCTLSLNCYQVTLVMCSRQRTTSQLGYWLSNGKIMVSISGYKPLQYMIDSKYNKEDESDYETQWSIDCKVLESGVDRPVFSGNVSTL